MQGIYLIINNLTQDKYIGQSKNITLRWGAHRRNYKNPNEYKSCPKLYQAFLDFDIENFSFFVLELVNDTRKLTERETYWINFYNSIENGYNSMLPDISGILNPKHSLKIDEVITIQNLLATSKLLIADIARTYNVELSTIYRINKGETWYNNTLTYPIRKWNNEERPGSKNGQSIFSEEEVLAIRQRYVNETVNQIYIDYQDKCSLSGFKKIVQGTTFKNVPVYKKKEKRWIK